MERSFKELRSFVFGRVVDVAEGISSLFVTLKMCGILDLHSQALRWIIAFNESFVVNNATDSIDIIDGVCGLIQKHAVEDDVFCNTQGAVFLGVSNTFALTTFFQRLLAGSKNEQK